jgi:hypothetical protein
VRPWQRMRRDDLDEGGDAGNGRGGGERRCGHGGAGEVGPWGERETGQASGEVGLSDWNRDFVDSNLVVWAGCVWLSGTSLAIVRYIYIYIYEEISSSAFEIVSYKKKIIHYETL